MKILHARVRLAHAIGMHGEQLAPVRTHTVRCQQSFDGRQQALNVGPLVLPGEVNRHRIALVLTAQPEVVARNRPDFADVEQPGDVVLDGG